MTNISLRRLNLRQSNKDKFHKGWKKPLPRPTTRSFD